MILYFDFETYHDSEYSLKKMPVHQYIRDPRFRVLGLGAAINDGAVAFSSDMDEIKLFLDLLDWSKVVAVAHNAQFDGAILYEKYGYAPAMWVDTMLLARWAVSTGRLPYDVTTSLGTLAPLVGAEKGNLERAITDGDVAGYCRRDVDITRRLSKYLMDLKPPKNELKIMDLHVRMATEPVLHIDEGLLRKTAHLPDKVKALHEKLRKDDIFQALLEKRGIEVEYKTTLTGRQAPAFAKTDDFMVRLLNHPNSEVARLAELRLEAQSSITRTRARRMLDIGSPLPVPLLYFAAHTGRSGGSGKINLQNLPRRGPLRQAITAPPGHIMVVGDSRQVEVRVLAWLANDKRLLHTFQTSDPYRTFAAEYMYHCSPDEVTAEQRRVAKSAVLALGFGQSVDGFLAYCQRQGVDIVRAVATTAHISYHLAYTRIKQYWYEVASIVAQIGEYTLPGGRRLVYPRMATNPATNDLVFIRPAIFSKTGRPEQERTYGARLVENVVQATARDVVYWQALQLAQEGLRPVLLVHDEIVCVVEEAQKEYAMARLLHWLRTPPTWAKGLPVDGEVSSGRIYADCK
jgi:DNA polymerase